MQVPDVGREVVKEIHAAVKLEVFRQSSNISQDHPDRTSHSEGLSMFNLPSYVFKGVLVTFKKSEAFAAIRSCQLPGDGAEDDVCQGGPGGDLEVTWR